MFASINFININILLSSKLLNKSLLMQFYSIFRYSKIENVFKTFHKTLYDTVIKFLIKLNIQSNLRSFLGII